MGALGFGLGAHLDACFMEEWLVEGGAKGGAAGETLPRYGVSQLASQVDGNASPRYQPMFNGTLDPLTTRALRLEDPERKDRNYCKLHTAALVPLKNLNTD